MKTPSPRALGSPLLLFLLCGCSAQPPEGRLFCSASVPCPPGWSCRAGLCYSTGCAGPGDCDDGEICTTDTCTGGVCGYSWNSLSCEDGLFCNGAEVCGNGACMDQPDPCDGWTGCDEANRWCLCDDGDPCTAPDVVVGGWCVGTPADGLFCGACNDTGCRICCGGLCVDGNNTTHCAGCGACDTAMGEQCLYSPGLACGWPWCCSR